jgi:hypothetical protein
MERILEIIVLRYGGIPWCCGGASVCFAAYSVQISYAAQQWTTLANQVSHKSSSSSSLSMQQLLPRDDPDIMNVEDEEQNKQNQLLCLSNDRQSKRMKEIAEQLHQHAATCVALAITSTVTTLEATRDWHTYKRFSTLWDMEQWLLRQQPPRRIFFLRTPVLGTALTTFGLVHAYLGGIRFFVWHIPHEIHNLQHRF